MTGYGTNAIEFLIETLFDLYVMVVALRMMMQAVGADYYNPLAQFVVKATNPPLLPLRRLIPGFGRYDVAAIVLAIVLLFLKLFLLQSVGSRGVAIAGSLVYLESLGPGNMLWLSVVELIALLFNIVFFAIIIQVIISWVSPGGHSPVTVLLHSLTRPVLGPIQRFVPPMGGLDLSPLVAIIALQVAKMLLLPPLLLVL